MFRHGIRSHEFSVLLSRDKTLEQISESVSGSIGLIPELLDFETSGGEETMWKEAPILHEKWRCPFLYYSIGPAKSQMIQTPFYFRLIISAGTVAENALIGLCKVPLNFVNWKSEQFPRLSVPFTICKVGGVAHLRKITILYPISKGLWSESFYPKFFRVAGEKPIEIETDIVNGKLLKVNRENVGDNAFCIAEVETNWVVVLALVPHINHSLFRTGAERVNLTKNICLSIDKNLVREKPMELVTKVEVILIAF